MPRILVVDDMGIFREPLSAALRGAGYETEEAADGREALAKCRTFRPDLILLDIVMPVTDGFQFLEALRADNSLGHTAVMVLSEVANRQAVHRALQLGVKDYLLKTRFSLSHMLERIAKNLAPSRTVSLSGSSNSSGLPANREASIPVIELPQLLTRQQCLARTERALEGRALSAVTGEVLAMTNSPRADLADIATVIGRDPILAARVLKTSNSAAFIGNRKMMASIPDAVRHLGVGNIRNIVLSLGVFEAMPAQDTQNDFNPVRSWQHSFTVAALCEQLAVRSNKEELRPGLLYVVGLCHELGKILFRTLYASEYEEVMKVHAQSGHPLHQIERQMLGASQLDLSQVILKRLGLPNEIRLPIDEFHSARTEFGRKAPLPAARLLRLADLYANGMMLSSSASSEIEPITKEECLTVIGEEDPPRPDGANMREQVMVLTHMLSGLRANQSKELSRPILPTLNKRICLVRHRCFSKFDPIEAALNCLGVVCVVDEFPGEIDIQSWDIVVMVWPSRQPIQANASVPILRLSSEPGRPDTGIVEEGPSLSLQELYDAIANCRVNEMQSAA